MVELIRASSVGEAADPASEEDIRALEQRLGISLPNEVRALYRQVDGLPELTIGPIAEIERASDTFARLRREGALEGDKIPVSVQGEGDTNLLELPLARAQTWVSLGEMNGERLPGDRRGVAIRSSPCGVRSLGVFFAGQRRCRFAKSAS